MSAATQARNTPQMGFSPIIDKLSVPLAASTLIYKGVMVALAGGYLVNVTATPGLNIIGRAEPIGASVADNSSGGNGGLTIDVRQGVFKWANSSGADAIIQANVGGDCYAVDNQTVALTSSNGTRSRAGTVVQVDSDGVWVEMGLDDLGFQAIFNGIAVHRARGVVTTNVADVTNFSVGSRDGLTYVAGDAVLLVGQTTAAQNGLYKVGAVNAGVALLTRSAVMANGAGILNGLVVEISEGTLWAGSSWKALCTGSNVVGTNDPVFYPRTIHRTVTLVAGAYTFGSADEFMLFSTTKSQILITRNTANTSTATTGGYTAPAASRTAGINGTGAALVRAEVAAGTLNNADVSSLDVHIVNW